MDGTGSALKPGQLLAEIAEQIVAHFDPQQIILFGSYARAEARADSDLDLLIVAPSEDAFVVWGTPRRGTGIPMPAASE